MSLAELKRRLQPGVKLRLVERNGSRMNALRTVAKVQTNAVAFKADDEPRLTWLYWPKRTAGTISLVPDGFILAYSRSIRLRYQWVTPQTNLPEVPNA